MELLLKFRSSEAKPITTPVMQGTNLSKLSEEVLENVKEYRQLVGSLQYLTMTRLNISYAISQVSQFLHNPRTLAEYADGRRRGLRITKRRSRVQRTSSRAILGILGENLTFGFRLKIK